MQLGENQGASVDYSGKELFELKYFPVEGDGSDPQAEAEGEGEWQTNVTDRDVFAEVSRTFSNKQMEAVVAAAAAQDSDKKK